MSIKKELSRSHSCATSDFCPSLKCLFFALIVHLQFLEKRQNKAVIQVLVIMHCDSKAKVIRMYKDDENLNLPRKVVKATNMLRKTTKRIEARIDDIWKEQNPEFLD